MLAPAIVIVVLFITLSFFPDLPKDYKIISVEDLGKMTKVIIEFEEGKRVSLYKKKKVLEIKSNPWFDDEGDIFPRSSKLDRKIALFEERNGEE